MHVVPNFSTCKLLCEYRGKQVKIEVNKTKRGIVGGAVQSLPLSEKAQEEFSLFCEANVVPLTQLYGGKIAAALSRQHPRDLFDVKYMDIPLSKCREGLIFCLLGSDRPIHESFAPRLIDRGHWKSSLNSLEYFKIIRKLSIDSFDSLWIIVYLYCVETQTIMLPVQGTIHFSDYSSLYDIVVPKNNKLRLINELVDFSFIYVIAAL